LPIGYYGCFTLGFGVVGLWMGLGFGLGICGVVLVAVWHRRSSAPLPGHVAGEVA
jgi:Na+-driven multidrug efflux pump